MSTADETEITEQVTEVDEYENGTVVDEYEKIDGDIESEKVTDVEKSGKVEECRDFKKGGCRRGSRCKFFHAKVEVEVCRDFLTKGCGRINCRFVHMTREEDQEYKESGRLPDRLNSDGSTRNGGFDDGIQGELLGRKRKADSLGIMQFGAVQQAVLQNNQSSSICRDFERGDCSRGTRCRYYHPKLKICRDFQNDKCGRESCRFLHMSRDEENSYLSSGKTPDHIDDIDVKKNKIIDMPRGIPSGGGNAFDIGSMLGMKRHKDDQLDFISASPKHILVENEVLKQKIAELQLQITDLHRMNDTLYQQNATYRNQIRGSI